ncbi:hypothetical protein Emag_001009 [Eimeria magna]
MPKGQRRPYSEALENSEHEGWFGDGERDPRPQAGEGRQQLSGRPRPRPHQPLCITFLRLILVNVIETEELQEQLVEPNTSVLRCVYTPQQQLCLVAAAAAPSSTRCCLRLSPPIGLRRSDESWPSAPVPSRSCFPPTVAAAIQYLLGLYIHCSKRQQPETLPDPSLPIPSAALRAIFQERAHFTSSNSSSSSSSSNYYYYKGPPLCRRCLVLARDQRGSSSQQQQLLSAALAQQQQHHKQQVIPSAATAAATEAAAAAAATAAATRAASGL